MAISAVAKQIKPKKLKQKEFRLELLNSMRKVGRKMRKDFQATTRTWEKKPEFEVVVSISRKDVSVLVGTDNPIYRYVSEGTKPHIIVPVKAKALAFQSGYRAKTTPRVIGSTAGGRSGNKVFAQVVQHPGTEAREFGKTITSKWRRPFKREMEAAMKRAAKKSGHGFKKR